MQIDARRIKMFKIRNRSGYAAICANHLTEGKSLPQTYDRMVKALRRNNISLKNSISNLKKLVISF